MDEVFYTAKELAAYLRTDYETVLAMAKKNELPCFRWGNGMKKRFRFPVKAIEAWIASQMGEKFVKP